MLTKKGRHLFQLEGTVIGEREGLKQTETITMKVSEGADEIAQSAIEMHNAIIPKYGGDPNQNV